MLLAGFITFVACILICLEFNNIHLTKYLFEITKILVVIPTCLIMYVGLNLVFKMDYAQELVGRVLKHKEKLFIQSFNYTICNFLCRIFVRKL